MTKLRLSTFVIAAMSIALLSCGKAPPGTSLGSPGGPELQESLVGKSYNLTQVLNTLGSSVSVPANGMTITLASTSQVTGSFACFLGTTQSGTAQFTANVTWSQTAVTFSGLSTTPSNCQPNYYFTLQPTMEYQITANQLTLINFSRTQSAVFTMQ